MHVLNRRNVHGVLNARLNVLDRQIHVVITDDLSKRADRDVLANILLENEQ